MLTNFDLERLARFYHLPLVTVCMKDELPKKPRDGAYIINLQSSIQGSGSHWTGLFIHGYQSAFFDSFGAPPSTEIVDFVKKRKGAHLLYNNFIIQDLKSDRCGWYTLAFLLFMYNDLHLLNSKVMNKIFNEFVDSFSSNTKANDEILKSFFATSALKNRPNILNKYLK